MMVASVSPVILMLEHDDDDRFITSQVFEDHQFKAHIEFVQKGEALFAYLDRCRESRYGYPAMILLNLHTTPQDGRELLKQLKENSYYKHIPVVVLSGSSDPIIAKECYALGASSFIQKPSQLSETNEKIGNFFRYWFNTVELV
jgi:CheY-like chemotaxis protein